MANAGGAGSDELLPGKRQRHGENLKIDKNYSPPGFVRGTSGRAAPCCSCRSRQRASSLERKLKDIDQNMLKPRIFGHFCNLLGMSVIAAEAAKETRVATKRAVTRILDRLVVRGELGGKCRN